MLLTDRLYDLNVIRKIFKFYLTPFLSISTQVLNTYRHWTIIKFINVIYQEQYTITCDKRKHCINGVLVL
jgi:hypothetical protein